MREAEGYRVQLARLSERFPNKEALSIKECCELLSLHRTTICEDTTFPKKKVGGTYRVPMVKLAQWMCKT